jgi:hypothetical protein
MRYILAFVLILSAQTVFAAEPSAQTHAEATLKFLKTVQEPEYIRTLSFYNYKNDKFLQIAQKMQAFWINNVHFASDITIPQQVPETDGLLYWIDIRDYDWNATAFSTVVRRETYCREPAITSAVALQLRHLIGVDQDPKTLHIEAMVRADWFFRETSEADRSDSYFDLLFAKRRFVQTNGVEQYEVLEEYGNWFLDGKAVDKGTPNAKWKTTETKKVVKTRAVPKIKFVEFPKDEKDFEKAFGVDGVDKFIEETGINLEHGAVVEGGEKFVSVVSRQNRLIKRKQGPVGAYYKTFDVKETTGKRDFTETLQKDFEFDAGEIITRTPAGGMATLVVNNKGKIAPTADNRFATDKSDITFDGRVRTGTSCFVCHESFAIKPTNMVEEMLKAGVQPRFKDKRTQVDARAFFLNWEDDLESDQAKFAKFIKRTSGFDKPGENAKNFKAWRDKYDSPVTLEIAAAEVGLTVEDFKLVGRRSTKARILNLVQGISMPRKTWEIDGYSEVIKHMRSRE